MAAKYVRYLIMDYDGVSCRLRGPDHNSRYKKYVDGMPVCCTSVRVCARSGVRNTVSGHT